MSIKLLHVRRRSPPRISRRDSPAPYNREITTRVIPTGYQSLERSKDSVYVGLTVPHRIPRPRGSPLGRAPLAPPRVPLGLAPPRVDGAGTRDWRPLGVWNRDESFDDWGLSTNVVSVVLLWSAQELTGKEKKSANATHMNVSSPSSALPPSGAGILPVESEKVRLWPYGISSCSFTYLHPLLPPVWPS